MTEIKSGGKKQSLQPKIDDLNNALEVIENKYLVLANYSQHFDVEVSPSQEDGVLAFKKLPQGLWYAATRCS